MKKLVGIGDLFIHSTYISSGMQSLKQFGIEVSTVDWKLSGFDELQHINLLVEQGGREDIPVPQEILAAVQDADILVTQFFPIGKALIDACPKLQWIGVLRAGYENVNAEYAKQKGIQVFHAIGRNAHAVSDFAVGAMICTARNIALGHYGIKNHQWIREYPNSASIPDMNGKTVGIIGYGEIGRLVAKKLSGFDVNILAYDPFCRSADVKLVDLETLMSESDFITVHARLTPENEHMLNAQMLERMKPTAYLINTSRSDLIDEAALCNVLQEHRIAGAFLDVFDHEPPQADDPLLALDNVTLTPHMAGGSKDAFYNTPKLLANAMIDALEGRPTRFLIS